MLYRWFKLKLINIVEINTRHFVNFLLFILLTFETFKRKTCQLKVIPSKIENLFNFFSYVYKKSNNVNFNEK